MAQTFTRTYNTVRFADPHKQCLRCGGWIDGVLDKPGPLVLVPCEHESDYRDVCPSWGPVDGCTCVEMPGVDPRKGPSTKGKSLASVRPALGMHRLGVARTASSERCGVRLPAA